MMRRRNPQVGDVVAVDAAAWASRHGTAPNPPQPVVHTAIVGGDIRGIATLADGSDWWFEHLTVVGGVSSLDRVRALRDFDDDVRTAYVEVLWGERTFAVHAAIRDLEAMRRGTEHPDRPLRDPETVLEVWTSPQGRWTLVQSHANGQSCIVAMGENWDMPLSGQKS